MITATIHPQCDNIIASTSYFDVDNISSTLTIKTNCKEEYFITLATTDTSITIIPDIVNSTNSSLPDGVYGLTFEIIQSDGTKVVDSKCLLVNCTLTCLMQDTYQLAAFGDETAIISSLAFSALLASSECGSCSCADICLLYNSSLLNTCANTTTNATGCGCS